MSSLGRERGHITSSAQPIFRGERDPERGWKERAPRGQGKIIGRGENVQSGERTHHIKHPAHLPRGKQPRARMESKGAEGTGQICLVWGEKENTSHQAPSPSAPREEEREGAEGQGKWGKKRARFRGEVTCPARGDLMSLKVHL